MDAVLNWLWQGGVVGVALFVTLFALQRAGANVRYIVGWAALLLIVALPALPTVLPTTVAADALLPTQADAVVSLPDAWWTSTLVILAAWMVWGSIQLVRFVSAIAAIRRARTRSRAIPSHLASVLPHWRRVRFQGRRATLVLSNSVTSAAVLGWGAPMIAVAPSLVRTLDADDLDRVLIHEWAHVQRHDDIVKILQIVIHVLAGWHPALWWIDRRLHVEREIACDEMTVSITGSPKSYAECLMKLSRLGGTPRAIQSAPAVFTPSGLGARVITIVSRRRPIAPVWSRALAATIVLVLCLVSVAVGGLTLVEATAFGQPLLPARMLTLGIQPDRLIQAAPAVTSETQTVRSPRRAPVRSSSQQRSGTTHPSPSPPPTGEPAAPPELQEPKAVASTDAPDTDPEPAPTVAPANVPYTPQAPPEAVIAEPPRSPWSAAAAGGTALGRKSKDAGIATAGVFTRLARRVAGSF